MTQLGTVVLSGFVLVAAMAGLVRSVAIEDSTSIPSPVALASAAGLDRTGSCVSDGPSPEEAAIEVIVRRHRPTAEEAWIRTLTGAIYAESLSADVDPLMTASIVASESSFQSRVVSRAGAMGLMQLRPFVARDVAARRQIAWSGEETLYSPEVNVRLGVLYLTELKERFDGDLRKALTAYNYGPTRVSRMIRDGEYDGSRYAETVLKRYERLKASASRCATLAPRAS